MKRQFLQTAAALGFVMFASSCANFNGPAEGRQTAVLCDTTNVSYARQVLPILQQNCLSCHSNAARQAGVTLEGYTNVRFYANNTLLVGSTSREATFISMPPSGPIPACDMKLIRAWVNQGAQNN